MTCKVTYCDSSVHVINVNYPRRVDGHGYSSLLVCVFVCLFVFSESTYLDLIAVQLQHG